MFIPYWISDTIDRQINRTIRKIETQTIDDLDYYNYAQKCVYSNHIKIDSFVFVPFVLSSLFAHVVELCVRLCPYSSSWGEGSFLNCSAFLSVVLICAVSCTISCASNNISIFHLFPCISQLMIDRQNKWHLE